MTLFDLLKLYESRNLQFASEGRRRQYRIQLKHLGAHLKREGTTDDLTDAAVTSFLSAFRAGRSPATVNKARTHLLALWRFAARKGIVSDWPDVPAMPEPRRTPAAWSSSQLARLWAALSEAKGFVGGIPAAAWWRSLHAVAWDTGERIGALLAVEPGHVDLADGWLHVPAENRKFGREDRLFPLHRETCQELRGVLAVQRNRGLVWPCPFSQATLYRRYSAILKRAELPADRRSKFHRMRRSAASHLKAAGGDAQALLGHASAATTRGYIDPRIAVEQNASSLLFRPGNSTHRRAS